MHADCKQPARRMQQGRKGGAKPGSRAPEGSKVMYLPRIRCNDCPGKVYTTLPLSMVEDFEKHLKNRLHRERVQERKRTGASSR